MKFILLIGLLGFSFNSFAEYVDGVYSSESAAEVFLSSRCGELGELMDQYALDGDYDYYVDYVEFENAWATVTVQRIEYPEPWNEYDYYINDFTCLNDTSDTDHNTGVPVAIEAYVDDFFSANCEVNFDYKLLSVAKFSENIIILDNVYTSFDRGYNVFYNNEQIGEAFVEGVSAEDEEPVSTWSYSVSCPSE